MNEISQVGRSTQEPDLSIKKVPCCEITMRTTKKCCCHQNQTIDTLLKISYSELSKLYIFLNLSI